MACACVWVSLELAGWDQKQKVAAGPKHDTEGHGDQLVFTLFLITRELFWGLARNSTALYWAEHQLAQLSGKWVLHVLGVSEFGGFGI